MQRQPFGQVDERQTKTRQHIKQTENNPHYIVINISNSNININPPLHHHHHQQRQQQFHKIRLAD